MCVRLYKYKYICELMTYIYKYTHAQIQTDENNTPKDNDTIARELIYTYVYAYIHIQHTYMYYYIHTEYNIIQTGYWQYPQRQ